MAFPRESFKYFFRGEQAVGPFMDLIRLQLVLHCGDWPFDHDEPRFSRLAGFRQLNLSDPIAYV